MIRYFSLVLGAHFRSGRSLYLLTVAGVTLGVASVLGIQIINRNAVAAFSGTVDAISGRADLSVVSRSTGLPDTTLVAVLRTPGVQAAWPLVRTEVALDNVPGGSLEIIGADFLAPVSGPGEPIARNGGLETIFSTPGWVAVSRELAVTNRWALGDTVTATTGIRRHPLTIGAIWERGENSPFANRRLAFMDIAAAQSLFGTPGIIQQVDLRLHDSADPDRVAADLGAALGPGVTVTDPDTQKRDAANILAAFRLNLTALSLISVFVGMFLVFSSTQAALVRRRREIGVLRALGASRPQVLGVIAGEVAVLGLLGVALGLPLGYWIARANVESVNATLTNLYLLERIDHLRFPPALLGLAAAVGVGGAVAGALFPALDMVRRDPNSLLTAFAVHDRTRDHAGRTLVIGLAFVALVTAWYATVGAAWRPSGFVICFAAAAAIPLFAPFTARHVFGLAPTRDFGLFFAVRSLAARLSHTTLATSALGVAVAMLVGITFMIHSFRETLDTWMGSTVRADIYVATESWRGQPGLSAFDAPLIDSLEAFPGVRAVDRLRSFRGTTRGRRIGVAGVDFGFEGAEVRFPLKTGGYDAVFRRFRDAALISEPLSRKEGLDVGDTLVLDGPAGAVPLEVAGVYYDYGNESGAMVTSHSVLTRYFGADRFTAVALYLEPDADLVVTFDALAERFRDTPIVFRSNRGIRAQALEIFDQTFAITTLLQATSLLIAATAVTLTLLILARERLSELALYRALGATRRQIFAIYVGMGAAISALGIGLGSAGGIVLAGILIHVINPTYFGWTIQTYIPGGTVSLQLLSILGASVAASVYPALRASRVPATELRREDS